MGINTQLNKKSMKCLLVLIFYLSTKISYLNNLKKKLNFVKN